MSPIANRQSPIANRQSPITLSTKDDLNVDDLSVLEELNKEARKHDHRSLLINPDFYSKLQLELEMTSAHDDNGHNGGYVNNNIIQVEYQEYYMHITTFRD